MQIIDRRTIATPGPAGDVTPEAAAARDEAVAARTAAQTARTQAQQARDQAQQYAEGAEAFQDEAVGGFLGDASSASREGARDAMGADIATAGLAPHEASLEVSTRAMVGTPRRAGLLARLRQGVLDPSLSTKVCVVGASTFRAGSAPYIGMIERLARAAGASGLPLLDDVTSVPSGGMRWFQGAVGGVASNAYLPEARLQKIALVAPHYVIHGIGSNDYGGTQTPLNTYKANVRSKCARIESDTPGVVNILVHQQNRPDVQGKSISWEQYGEALREVAEEKPASRLFINLDEMLDLYTVGRTGNRFGLVADDNVHPSHVGHKVLAQVLGMALGIPTIEPSGEMRHHYGFPSTGTYSSNQRLATHAVKAASYPRILEVRVQAFVRGSTSGVCELQLYGAGYGRQVRIAANGTDYSTSLMETYYIEPGYSGDIALNVTVSGGGSAYISGGPAYSYMQVLERAF